MTMIYDIKCSSMVNYSRIGTRELERENSKSCDFIIRDYWGSKTCVKMNDGSEKVLFEPHSNNVFEDLTGKTFEQLLGQGRIITKDHKFCIKCFKTETGDDACECEEPELRDISTLEEGSLCPKCKVGQLKKMQKAIS